MKTKKRTNLIAFCASFFIGAALLFAQDVTTVNALSEDISENLDLEAVASVFGDAKDLKDFEQQLNDPKKQLSNLDLNEDNNVDYLRVVETAEDNIHVIAIQAVLGKDIYQDVATIEVEKDQEGKTQVQVVGDVYVYGTDYIIEPVYVHRPVIFSLFWRPWYRPYRSVFYWGYYPRHFHFWHPFHTHHYRKNVHVHINVRHTFRHTHVRRSAAAVQIHHKTKRNDYARLHPQKAYKVRVAGVNKANGTKKRALGVNQADGDKYRVAGVDKANGTKKRAAGVHKADGTKKRIAGVNQTDGDKYRAAGVKKPNGTTKRVAGATKADGTKKRANGDKVRVAGVTKPDGTKKRYASVTKADGTKKSYNSKGYKKRGKGTKAKKGYSKGKRGAKKGKANNGRKKKKKRN